MSLVHVVMYVLKLSCHMGQVLSGYDTALTPPSCFDSSCGSSQCSHSIVHTLDIFSGIFHVNMSMLDFTP